MSKLLSDEQATIDTYNQVAKLWAAHYSDPKFWADEMRRFHELLPAGKILDVGAGAGRDVKPLLSLGYEYRGTEISEGLLKILRNKYPKQKFFRQNIYELHFEHKFDGFWCAAVLLHIPKSRIAEALKAIKSVVKPGAVGFISIKDGKGEKMEYESWDDSKKRRRLFAYWPKDEFSNVLDGCNFEVLDYKYRPEQDRPIKWHCFFVRSK